jgi:hypothetical protein
MLPVVFLIAGQSAVILALLCGRIRSVHFHPVMAVLSGSVTGLAVWSHWTLPAYVGAICTAAHAWQWSTRGVQDG